MNYEIRYVRGHVEVYDQMGRFRFPPHSEGVAVVVRDQHPPPYPKNTRRPRLGRPRLPI